MISLINKIISDISQIVRVLLLPKKLFFSCWSYLIHMQKLIFPYENINVLMGVSMFSKEHINVL
jgi:hypothetical protein